jgi:hypothetical protein
MPSISVPGALLGGAAIGGIGSIAGGLISAGGAQSAANAQLQATQEGIAFQQQQKAQTLGLLQPYLGVGQSGVNQLAANIGSLTKPFNPTMADLAATPGYQFTLNQGEQGVANMYSGQGLGAGVQGGATAMTPSGPGIKGATQYAENLASTTYQQQFQNYLGQNQQLFNMMFGQAGMGEQAAAAYGGIAQNATNAISGLTSAGGAAVASGIQSGANAIGQGITGATSGISNFALANALGGGNLFGGGGGGGGISDSTFNGLTDSMIMG